MIEQAFHHSLKFSWDDETMQCTPCAKTGSLCRIGSGAVWYNFCPGDCVRHLIGPTHRWHNCDRGGQFLVMDNRRQTTGRMNVPGGHTRTRSTFVGTSRDWEGQKYRSTNRGCFHVPSAIIRAAFTSTKILISCNLRAFGSVVPRFHWKTYSGKER